MFLKSHCIKFASMATLTKRGKSWFVQVRRKGVSASKSFPTKMMANAWATQTEHEINSGTYYAGSTKTMADAISRYHAEVTPKKRAAENEKYLLAVLSRSPFASECVSDITTEMLARYRDTELAHLKPGSVQRYLGLLSNIFETMRTEWQWINKNPCNDLKKPSSGPSRDRVFSDDEIARVLEELGHNGPCTPVQQAIGDAFLFALETAMRAGEIRGLKWEEIDLEKRVAHLPKTKIGEKRNVPLSSKAIDILKSRRSLERPFKLNAHTLSYTFAQKLEKAGIKNATFHDTRHTAITRLAKILQPFDLARMAGHKNMSMTLRYFNATAEQIAEQLG